MGKQRSDRQRGQLFYFLILSLHQKEEVFLFCLVSCVRVDHVFIFFVLFYLFFFVFVYSKTRGTNPKFIFQARTGMLHIEKVHFVVLYFFGHDCLTRQFCWFWFVNCFCLFFKIISFCWFWFLICCCSCFFCFLCFYFLSCIDESDLKVCCFTWVHGWIWFVPFDGFILLFHDSHFLIFWFFDFLILCVILIVGSLIFCFDIFFFDVW